MASTAPFSTRSPLTRTTPLARVSALNGCSSAIRASMADRPASSPSPPASLSSARRARASATIERPSGVSSRSEATSAAWRTSPSEIPGAGVIAEASRLPHRDRAGLVEQDHVHVAGRLHGAPAHREHVEPRDAVHAGDPDRRQQAADRGRDQAHQQGDERHGVDGRPGVEPERPEGDGRHQEHDGQPGQQDRQGDLVRGALPLRALDEGDHPVEERLARVGRHADHEACRW